MLQDCQENQSHEPMRVQARAALPRLRVGLLGLGTVGAGTYRVLNRNQLLIQACSGSAIAITMIAVRDLARAAGIVDSEVAVTSDPFAVVTHPDIDVVVEAIGGTTLARDLVLQAIAHGKHVVTANKALLAEHGAQVFAAARERGVILAYEGAVAVSIPIIKALREGLVANRVEWLAGIVNGTSNFILTAMQNRGLDFASALRDAQRRGYAEADPRLDVDGVDAAHKLALLAANAFGTPLQLDHVHTQGIANLDTADMVYAQQLGYRIKLLASAMRDGNAITLRVQPTLLPQQHMLASVDDAMNAVLVNSDAAGLTLFYGAGAGSEQTASAVLADLVDVARAVHVAPRQRVPALGFQETVRQHLPVIPVAETRSHYYIRADLIKAEGAEQAVLQPLAESGIVVQAQRRFARHASTTGQALVLLTALTQEAVLRRALRAVPETCTVLRVEHFDTLAADAPAISNS